MREEDEILQMVYHFIKAGLTHDVDGAMSVVSDSVMGVGMNEQGTASSKEELRKLLEAQSKTGVDSFEIGFPDSRVRYHPPSFATGSVVYELRCLVEGTETIGAFIQTFAAKKEDGAWMLCFLQAVPVELTEESIEHYPLKFADKTLAELRAELQEDSFQFLSRSLSVGILGAFVDEGELPPFYVNDTMLHLLGYTRDEFLQLLAKDSFAVVHPDDQERARKEIEAAVAKAQEYTCQYRLVKKSGAVVWAVEYGKCLRQDGRDAILSAFVDVTELMQLQTMLREKNETILSSINYAARIQQNLLPAQESFRQAFADFSVLWLPKDIVGGDVYWLKTFTAGTVLCVGDCTGHGIPGALLTMLVSTALDSLVNEQNCKDTAQILYDLDRRGAEILHAGKKHHSSVMDIRDGCDLAVLFVDHDGAVTFSSANMPVFVCDGREVKRYKGQRIHIGEGHLTSPQQVERVQLAPDKDAVYYVASDGLFDQVGGAASVPFGSRVFRELVLRHHGEKQSLISQKVWEAFEKYRGATLRRDDVELVSFRP